MSDHKTELEEYTARILDRVGTSSPMAEREIIRLAGEGNHVAEKNYADMLFYGKIKKKHRYRKAFEWYMKSAALSSSWEMSQEGGSCPTALWIVGYYLVNYRRESALSLCEEIEAIEAMSLEDRLARAFILALESIALAAPAGAYNLAGRVLQETAADDGLYAALAERLALAAKDALPDEEGTSFDTGDRHSMEEASLAFFRKAADQGYVYACNNLAAREADRIVELFLSPSAKDVTGEKELEKSVESYIRYLKLSADRYEPYAANRLGLFYINGEVKSPRGKAVLKEYTDHALAREYFVKATVYHDANSAWAYFNLMKYFHKEYVRDIDLMNEHMDYIKELNPEVYDLAIEL